MKLWIKHKYYSFSIKKLLLSRYRTYFFNRDIPDRRQKFPNCQQLNSVPSHIFSLIIFKRFLWTIMADCCVCLEPLKNELVQMKHCCKKWLHYECLKRSIAKSSGSCPFCRKRILTWFRKTPRAELISVPTERSLLKQNDEGTIFPVFTFIRLTILQFNLLFARNPSCQKVSLWWRNRERFYEREEKGLLMCYYYFFLLVA